MDTVIECLEKRLKVFYSVKYEVLSKKESLILSEQKTETEIDKLILKFEDKIAEFEAAITFLKQKND